jgi:dolichyl-phosphate-mannose--protein O-mannosyl transferase
MGCNACLHFYPQIQQKEVRAVTTLLNSTCVVVLVLTAPTSGYDVFLCIPKEGEKCNIAMHELHIL